MDNSFNNIKNYILKYIVFSLFKTPIKEIALNSHWSEVMIKIKNTPSVPCGSIVLTSSFTYAIPFDS